jgi:hypothetical protein
MGIVKRTLRQAAWFGSMVDEHGPAAFSPSTYTLQIEAERARKADVYAINAFASLCREYGPHVGPVIVENRALGVRVAKGLGDETRIPRAG